MTAAAMGMDMDGWLKDLHPDQQSAFGPTRSYEAGRRTAFGSTWHKPDFAQSATAKPARRSGT